jgi:hypothetical protein
LKQSGIVEDFIVSFECLAFSTEGMTDAFFRESVASKRIFGPMSSWLDLRVGWRLLKKIKKHKKLFPLKTVSLPLSLALN